MLTKILLVETGQIKMWQYIIASAKELFEYAVFYDRLSPAIWCKIQTHVQVRL